MLLSEYLLAAFFDWSWSTAYNRTILEPYGAKASTPTIDNRYHSKIFHICVKIIFVALNPLLQWWQHSSTISTFPTSHCYQDSNIQPLLKDKKRQHFHGIHLTEYKVIIYTYTQFFNASGLPETTPSHRNTMSYAIVDEEWRHKDEHFSQFPCVLVIHKSVWRYRENKNGMLLWAI